MLPLFIGLFTILLVIILLSKLHSLDKYNIGWFGLVFLVIITVSVISVKSGFVGMRDGFVGAPVDYTLGKCGGLKYGDVADIATVTGNYDGLKLKGGIKPDYKILAADKVAYHSPVGDAYALNPDLYMTPTYAPIDGKAGSPRMMSMFAFNRSSPECCPSTFSSDRGCVCMSQAQRDFINMRGNQKHENGNPDF
jgi:hypothetical protein